MDLDFDIPAILQVASFKKQLNEIEVESEIKRNKLIKGEKDKTDLQQEIEMLEKEKLKLQQSRSIMIPELELLKSKTFELDEQRKSIMEMEEEHKIALKNADEKLWETSQSAYSDLINYCDNIQEFFEDLNYIDIVGKIMYGNSGDDGSDSSETFHDKKFKIIEELKMKHSEFKWELIDLISQHQVMKDLVAEKVRLRHEPSEGKEFLELNTKLANCKEVSKELSNEIFISEAKRGIISPRKYIADLVVTPDHLFEYDIEETQKETPSSKQSCSSRLSNWHDNPNTVVKIEQSVTRKHEKSDEVVITTKALTKTKKKAVNKKPKTMGSFVPKVGKYFKPSSSQHRNEILPKFGSNNG